MEPLLALIGSFGVVTFLLFGAGLYFIPTIIAFARGKSNKAAILALNFFLGWSLIGWVVSLVWALANEQPQQVVIYNLPPQTPPQSPEQ